MATATDPLISLEGTIVLRSQGSDHASEVATFEVNVPILLTPTAGGELQGLVDQDALRTNLADALEAVAAELRAGA